MRRLTMWVGLIIFFAVALPAFSQQTAEEYFNKGIELYETNDYPAAVASFKKALELKPDYLEAEYNLAITYWTQKDYPKAISTLESLDKKAPDTDIGKRITADLKKLKEPIVPVVVPKTTEETKKVDKNEDRKVDATLTKSIPELIADLKFGLLAKRITATNQLRIAETDEAINALVEVAFNEREKLEVRGSAIQNLARIKNPKALSTVDRALAGTSFSKEEKFKLLVVLADQETPEAFKVILKFWFLAEWPMETRGMSAGIKRKEWPPELGDPRMWTMTKTLGREESLPLFIASWPGIIESTDIPIPEGERDYVFYYNLMTGFLKGDISVPVLAQRLKEDYPAPPQLTLEGPPSPGFTSPIIKPASQRVTMPPQPGPGGPPQPGPGGPPQPRPGGPSFPGSTRPGINQTAQETPSWTVEDEVKLRVEMVAVLGGVAGESQGPFLEYLALNDPKTAINNTASEALKSLNIRVARSKENYNQGLKLLESGNLNEAISLFEQVLKENSDTPYRKNINKTFISTGLQFLEKGNKERAASLLRPLYQLVSGALAQETMDSERPGLMAPGGAAGEAKLPPTDTSWPEMVKKIIRDQLAVLEIPSASIKAQDIQNIYDLGLELGIIKKPEPAFSGEMGAPGMPPGMPMPPGPRGLKPPPPPPPAVPPRGR